MRVITGLEEPAVGGQMYSPLAGSNVQMENREYGAVTTAATKPVKVTMNVEAFVVVEEEQLSGMSVDLR